MNKAWQFFKNYLVIVVALPTIAAVLGGIYAVQEISPQEYRILTNAWPHLHQQRTNDLIREAMADGKIVSWDYAVLWRAAIDDAGLLSTEGASEDVGVERQTLQQTIEGVSAK